MRIHIVASRFNPKTTDAMLKAAEQRIKTIKDAQHGGTTRVPGTFDTPLAVDRALARRDVDGVVVIGAVITGETDHDQVIMHATAKTLQELSIEHGKPVMLAITGPGMTPDQATARVEVAARSIDGCIEMGKVVARRVEKRIKSAAKD